MVELAMFPYMTRRRGSRNLCYKRPVPRNLQSCAGRKQIWRSLETGDELDAKEAYRRIDADTDELFGRWRREQNGELPSAPIIDTAPLTAALARRVLDRWRVQLIEDDFKLRGTLWKAVEADPEELSRMPYRVPKTWPHDPFDAMREDGAGLEKLFLYVMRRQTVDRLADLESAYRRGEIDAHLARLQTVMGNAKLSPDDALSLARRAMAVEIEVVKDIIAGNPIVSGFEDELVASDEPTPPRTRGPSPTMGSSDTELRTKRSTLNDCNWPIAAVWSAKHDGS